jgi:signal peptidase I
MKEHLSKLDKLLERNLAYARKSTFREYVESIGVAVIIALLLRAFIVEAFKIPSGSMIPTLEVGDHLFVAKFIYGIRIPWTEIKFLAGLPSRGDVVVFIPPHQPDKDFIKRAIAVGGDTVAVRKNVVYINGKPITRVPLKGTCEFYDKESQLGDDVGLRECVAFVEEHGDQRYHVYQSPYSPPQTLPQASGCPCAKVVPGKMPKGPEDCAEKMELVQENGYEACRVPEGHVFFMGDNRDNSEDSRVWGVVHKDNLKGKALIIWWSNGAPEGFRGQRIFKLVHGDVEAESKAVGPAS